MDFFERQDQARRNTRLLVVYFVLAVVLIVAAVYLFISFLFLRDMSRSGTLAWLWSPKLFFSVASSTLAIILGSALCKIIELRSVEPPSRKCLAGGWSVPTPRTRTSGNC
jgi:hypothetical protein